MLHDLLVGGGYGCAHPVGGVDIAAKSVRVAELAMGGLGSDGLPHVPGLSGAVLELGQVGGVGLVTVAGGVSAAAIGDEHQIVFNEVDALLLAILDIQNLLCDFFVTLSLDDDVFHIHAVLDPNPMGFQILYQRHNQALILVQLGEPEGAEVGQAVDMMDIAAEVAFHFQGAGPALEGKHGLPVDPEVGLPEGVRQYIGNFLALQILFRGDEQLGQSHGRFLVQVELLVSVGVIAAIDRSPAERVVGVMLVEPVVFIQHGDARLFQGGHVAEHVPHDLEVVVHFPAAPHEEALGHVLTSVAAAAGEFQLLQQVDMLALHLTVADQIKGRRQAGQACANDISGLLVHVLGLFGMGERFISSSRVIHHENLLQ